MMDGMFGDLKQTSYETYYNDQLEKAEEYQDFVTDRLWERGLVVNQYTSKKYQWSKGESRGGIEIKYDYSSLTTSNLYIECEEKSHPDNDGYVASGIYRDDNAWLYVIGNYDKIWVFAKTILVLMHKSKAYREVEANTKTSIGYLLPQSQADIYAAFVIG
jgi:hypothetical protein